MVEHDRNIAPDWHKTVIGNRVHLAPSAGISDCAFRLMARLFGAGPLMTEMVSAHGMGMGRNYLLAEQLRMPQLERPLAVQLVGSDPKLMAQAAARAQEAGASSINLNMACPARKIVGSGKGCALMQYPNKAKAIMEAVVEGVSIPVTVKIRSGWDHSSINAPEFAEMAQSAGMKAVFIHARTRSQGYSGKADWKIIKNVRDAVTIPVVGNGDIRSGADAVAMVATTGCDGVMVGRGSMGRPWLFGQIIEELSNSGLLPAQDLVAPPPPPLPEFVPGSLPVPAILESGNRAAVGVVVRLHLALASWARPEKLVAKEMRKHLIWYSRGLAGCHLFRTKVTQACDIETVSELVDSFFTDEVAT